MLQNIYKKLPFLSISVLILIGLIACSPPAYTFEEYKKEVDGICAKELEVVKKATDKTITSSKEYGAALKASFEVYKDLSEALVDIQIPTGFRTSHDRLLAKLDENAEEVAAFNKGVEEEDGSVATLIEFIGKSSPQKSLSLVAEMEDQDFDDCLELAKYQDTVGLDQPIDQDLFADVKNDDPVETATKVCEILTEQITKALAEDTVKSDNGEFERFSLLLLSGQGKLTQVKPPVEIIGSWNKFIGQYGELAFTLSRYANLISNNVDQAVVDEAKAAIIEASSTFAEYSKELGVNC